MKPLVMVMAWLGMSSTSLSPFHCATTAWVSMALWYWAGVS